MVYRPDYLGLSNVAMLTANTAGTNQQLLLPPLPFRPFSDPVRYQEDKYLTMIVQFPSSQPTKAQTFCILTVAGCITITKMQISSFLDISPGFLSELIYLLTLIISECSVTFTEKL